MSSWWMTIYLSVVLISSLLREYGYTVFSFENAVDAIDALEQNRVNAVLSDIKMPGISGIELLERVRGISTDIPVSIDDRICRAGHGS